MPVFALPLAYSSTTQNWQPKSNPSSRVRFSSLPTRKRKRHVISQDSSTSEDEHLSLSSSDDGTTAASTNPLSLTPAEIAQYKLAGLEINEPLPVESIRDFPHRGLPPHGGTYRPKRGKAKGKDRARSLSIDSIEDKDVRDEKDVSDQEEEEPAKRPEQGPRLRLQHLSVLTTILQRCLAEGDMKRATRAWSMLIRMQFSGQAIDLRGSGYWGIGAELLVSSLNSRKNKFPYNGQLDSDTELQDEVIPQVGSNSRRWGTKEGLERAKEYFERLILQHPYKRQYDTSISALDFWPAMVGCEIYGIQYEQQDALAKLKKDEDDNEGGESRSGSEDEDTAESNEDEDQIDANFDADERRKYQRMHRRLERRWVAKDLIRQTALGASEKLAARLDELMTTPPYSDNQNLLRIRGMLALYIGDLSVPAEPGDEVQRSAELHKKPEVDSAKRLLIRQRMGDYQKGLKKRKEEIARARKWFGRIAKEGGDVEGLGDVLLGEEQEEGGDL